MSPPRAPVMSPPRAPVMSPPRAPGASAGKWASFDRLRLLAVVDIVAFHVDPTGPRPLLGVGLPIFLVLGLAFGVRRDPPAPAGSFVRRRLVRLGIPWLFWSAVYAFTVDRFRPVMLAMGTSAHLWFLPYFALAGVVLLGVHHAVAHLPRGRVAAVAAALGLAAAAAIHPVTGLGHPVRAWLFGLPALCFGLAAGRLMEAERPRPLLWLPVALPLAVAIDGGTLGRYAAATALVALALAWPGRPGRWTTVLTRNRYGVYCVHPLFCALPPLVALPPWPRVIAVLILSFATVALIRRTPLRTCV